MALSKQELKALLDQKLLVPAESSDSVGLVAESEDSATTTVLRGARGCTLRT